MAQRPIVTLLSPTLSGNAFGRVAVFLDLLQSDFEVRLLAFSESASTWLPLSSELSVECECFHAKSMFSFVRETSRRIKRTITGDLLLAVKPFPQTFGVGLWARRRLKIPLLLDIDDYELGFLSDSQYWEARHYGTKWVTSPVSPLYTRILDRFTAKADAVTVSNSFLEQRYGGIWIPHARDRERIDASVPNHDFGDPNLQTMRKVLFLGSPRLHKGLGDLLAAWRLVNVPNSILCIVGCPPNDPLVQQLSVDACENVRFFPEVSLRDAYSLIKGAGVFVVPQGENRASVGQLPMKLIDAMGCGATIVATTVGDIPRWLAPNAGILVAPNHPDALAIGIQTALTNPDRSRQLGENARQRFMELGSLESVRPRLLELIHSLI